MLMRLLRGTIAVVVAMNAALAAMPALMTLFYKLGVLHPRQDQLRFTPLMHVSSWLMLAILGASAIMFAISAALFTARSKGAVGAFWAGLVGEFIVYVLAQGPALDAAFTPEARMATAGLFLLLLVLGVLMTVLEPMRVLASGATPEPTMQGDLAAGPP